MPRFVCDAMLGSLARWLRFFGYDAEFMDPTLTDDVVAQRARDDDRWLLTRDRELASVGPKTMLVRSEDVESQLVEVFQRLGERPDASLDGTRCSECNGQLEAVAAEEVASVVPPYTLRTAPRFVRCRRCHRVYWPGSHGERILETMARVVERLESRR